MNCSNVQSQIDAYLQDEIHPVRAAMFEQHLTECDSCRQELELEREIRTAFHEIDEVPPMREGFAQDVFSTLAHRPVSHNIKRGFAMGFGTAIAASLAIWLGVTTLLGEHAGDPAAPVVASLPVVELAVAQVKPVRLLFNAPTDFNEVTLTVSLPSHVELDGFPGLSEVSWKTRLNAGQNVLKLPVIAHQAKQGDVIATISTEEKQKVFRVRLNAVNEGQVMVPPQMRLRV